MVSANLNTGRVDLHDSDPGADVAGDPEFDSVVDSGVTDEVQGVELEHVDAVHASTGLDGPATVRRLIEGGDGSDPKRDAPVHDEEVGGCVFDSDLVGVDGGEKHGYVEGEVGGGHDQVLDAHLLEIELGLLGFHGQEDDQDDRDEEEGQEGQEEEEAAAAALERRGRGGVGPLVMPGRVVGWWVEGVTAVYVRTGRHFLSFLPLMGVPLLLPLLLLLGGVCQRVWVGGFWLFFSGERERGLA